MELTGFNISCFCEISYLEYIYQECEKARRTPFGYPLPDNVHYTPGTCPNAEKTARSILCLGSHHSETVEGARKLAEAIRTTAEKMFK
jgi:dTDP-4-amino-4,6-dideoxygalactose transaminase